MNKKTTTVSRKRTWAFKFLPVLALVCIGIVSCDSPAVEELDEILLGESGEPTVKITGNAALGETLTAVLSKSNGEDTSGFAYQWITVIPAAPDSDEDIADATASTYTVQEADLGKQIKVTAKRGNTVLTSKPTKTVTETVATPGDDENGGSGGAGSGGIGNGNGGFAADGSVIPAVKLGIQFSLALTRDGKVYGSGDNQYGQLTGTGNKNTFTEITSGLEGKTIIAIATGAFHSLVLDSLGKVYGTGANWGGQLAYPANPIDAWTVSTFTEVTGLENKRIIAIAGAERTSLALASDGSVYAAGVNSQWPNYDQLSDQSSDGGNDFLLSFTKVSGLDDVTITAISMSTGQVAVVTSQGEVYLAGYHIVAREDEDPSTIFTKAIGLEGVPIVAISTYSTHTLALSRSGRVYGSGRYSVIGAGRAGDGSTEYAEFIPVVFSDGPAKEKKITAISAGFYFSLALTDEGKVYGVGNGFRGDTYARPNNATEHRFYPSTGLTNQIITAIAAGYESSLAMNSLGQVYGTGKNDAGQLTGVVYPAPPSYHLPDLRYIPTFTLATGL